MKGSSEKKNIARAAGILGSATTLSRVMGMIRDIVVARLFGAGMGTDAFFAAFQIPNMLRRFFAEGALTPAFVPTFSYVYTQQGEERAKEVANVCATMLTIVMATITTIGILCSPFIVHFMFPGFSQIPGKFELTVLLNRIMFPYIFFISLVALCMGILNTLRHFFMPAVSTVFLNLSMILSAFLLRDFFHAPIVALAVGVLIGGCVQLLLQLPTLWKKGFKLRPDFNFRIPEVQKIALLMLPATFGVGVYYLNITVSAVLASLLPQGSVSYLYYAQRLFEFPQGIFTVSVAQAVLPSMSKQAANGDMQGMKESLAFGLRLTLFITIPAMVGLMICAKPIMSTIFMGGKFDTIQVSKSAEALFFYCIGLSFVAMTRVLAPAFYALKDTKTPVYTAFAAFLINVILSVILMKPLLHGGLALATTLSSFANMTMLLWWLHRKIGTFDGVGIAKTALKSTLASLPMGLIVFYACHLTDWSASGNKPVKALLLGITLFFAILIYGISSKLLRSEEATQLLAIIKKKRSKS